MPNRARVASIDTHENLLTTNELRAAYLSHEKFIAEIVETVGNMKESDRFVALLVLRAI